MKSFGSLLLTTLAAATSVVARGHLRPAGYEAVPLDLSAQANMGNSTFEQLIDHNNPSLGTFSQSYMWSSQYWKGPGSPVILFTPGEVNASAYGKYLTTNRTTGALAAEIGAAVISLEHRYWGNSSPYPNLSTKNMQYLTLENSISDLTHFAKAVKLPFDTGDSCKPEHAPWILMGGSYSGALSAWTASTQPGTFYAYHASSAPVESINDYWQYFYPVQEGMPKNCSTDVAKVIDHIDNVLTTGTAKEHHALKAMFGLQDLVHNDDFGAAIENAPWLWQENQFYETAGFFDWCDAVENASANDTDLPGAGGVGLEKALAGYASYFNSTLLPDFCANYGYEEWQDTYSVACFDTYNATSPMYTDHTLSNTFDRQWIWMVCNEPFGYNQDGAPKNRPSIVSRLVTAEYFNRQCPLFFPPQGSHVVGIDAGKTEAKENAYTKGWNIDNIKHLLYANGGYDPWREAGVSSDFRTGGPLQSTAKTPVLVIPGGFHTSDLVTENAVVNPGAAKVIDEILAQFKTWVADYYKQR